MTVEEPATDGRRSMPRTTRAARPPRVLARGRLSDGKNRRLHVEQDGKIAASVELARDVRNVAAGFLESDRVEAAADCR